MGPLRFSRREIQEAAVQLQAHQRYSASMTLGVAGKRADELRRRAIELSNGGNPEAGVALAREAMAMFEPEDDGPIAAAVAFDLAVCVERSPGGSRMDQLIEAQQLFERSLRCEDRRADPLRHALSLDGLGRILRQIAERTTDSEEQASIRQRAILHQARACELCETAGPYGAKVTADYYCNLGNALREMGHVHEGVQVYERGLRWADYAAEHPQLSGMPVPWGWRSMLLCRFAGHLVSRKAAGDLRRARKLLQRTLGEARPETESYARMMMAESFLVSDDPGRLELAREQVRRMDIAELEQEQLPRLFGQLEELGEFDRALGVLRFLRRSLMAERQNTKADHAADEVAIRLQGFAVLEARLCQTQGRPIEAFLALENAASLRYHDAVSVYFHGSRDPVARELYRHYSRSAARSRWLDDFAARLLYVEEDEQLKVLREAMSTLVATDLIVDDGPEAREQNKEMLAVVDLALRHCAPVEALRDASQRYLERCEHLKHLAVERDPGLDEHREAWCFDTTVEGLRDIFVEYPDLTLLRLQWADDLLAVALWWEGGEVVGRATRVAVPREALQRLWIDPDGEQEASTSERMPLLDLLAGIDLTPVLPSGPRGRLVVLPSLAASRVPWAAVGPRGETLLDRFEAIVHLPMLTPLQMRQSPTPPREGVLVVAPGGAPEGFATKHHDLAFAEEHPEERRLRGSDASIAGVLAAARGATCVTFFAHGDHGGDEEGTLRLADGPLHPSELGDAFRGCERVELWACRSGVNQPFDWLTPLVDEAFGLDIAFHRAGARSSIGTLWSVSDLVTGQIARRYRLGLRRGMQAPEALASAQRWWRDRAVPSLRRGLLEAPSSQASRVWEDLLGVPAEPVEHFGLLGPQAEDEPPSIGQVDVWLRDLDDPRAWAGYRFVGVCERGPVEPWSEDCHRALTPSEQRELDRLLRAAAPEGA